MAYSQHCPHSLPDESLFSEWIIGSYADVAHCWLSFSPLTHDSVR